jgi:hypothetical protein
MEFSAGRSISLVAISSFRKLKAKAYDIWLQQRDRKDKEDQKAIENYGESKSESSWQIRNGIADTKKEGLAPWALSQWNCSPAEEAPKAEANKGGARAQGVVLVRSSSRQ